MYEAPDQPELLLNTEGRPVADCVQELVEVLQRDGIVPRSVVEKVVDLTVPEAELEAARAEAETLPSVEIGRVDLEWVQVHQCVSVEGTCYSLVEGITSTDIQC